MLNLVKENTAGECRIYERYRKCLQIFDWRNKKKKKKDFFEDIYYKSELLRL